LVRIKRIYDPPSAADGSRFLVERLWPRGLKREAARLTGWLKDLAPSPELRQWFGHDPKRWAEFQKRYRAELRAPEKQAVLRQLADQACQEAVTLVFAARDEKRNGAVVVRRLLEEKSS